VKNRKHKHYVFLRPQNIVCVDFPDLTPPRKRHKIHGGIHQPADCSLHQQLGLSRKESYSFRWGAGGTATLHIPKILSFGEVKISA
jgi:hypothetical protein